MTHCTDSSCLLIKTFLVIYFKARFFYSSSSSFWQIPCTNISRQDIWLCYFTFKVLHLSHYLICKYIYHQNTHLALFRDTVIWLPPPTYKGFLRAMNFKEYEVVLFFCFFFRFFAVFFSMKITCPLCRRAHVPLKVTKSETYHKSSFFLLK